MRIRLKTLWRVPVFCLAASWLSFHLTIHMGWFYVVKTTEPDGVINASADPVRTALVHAALFALMLLAGGLWFFRSMTKVEITVSAAIIAVFYLAVTILELVLPGSPLPFNIMLAQLCHWTGSISSLLYQAIHQPELSAVISCFAPFLFVPFGKKAVWQRDPGLTVEA